MSSAPDQGERSAPAGGQLDRHIERTCWIVVVLYGRRRRLDTLASRLHPVASHSRQRTTVPRPLPARDARPRARLLLAVIAAALAALAAYALFVRADAGSSIPLPPQNARQPAAITDHLREAHETAQRNPRSAATVGAYCVVLHADMFYAAAGQCYARVAALSEDWEWIYLRSLIEGDLGGGPALVRDLHQVVARAPDYGSAWLRLGDAEFKAGRIDEAERAWTRATTLPEPPRTPAPQGIPEHRVEVPLATHASLGLARIRLRRRDLEGAAEIVQRKIAVGPPFSSTWRLLAEIETARGNQAAADRALARARRLPPYAPYADPMVDRLALESRNSTFLLRLASEADLTVNGAWSEFLTRRAIEFDPDNPEVVVKLGRVLRTVGKPEEALVYFRRYESMVPGDATILAHIGSTLSELGRFDEAEPLLRRAAATLDDAVSHYNLALLLARTNRIDAAVIEYEEALERDASDIRARSNLAAALVRKGDLHRGAEELRRVLQLDPEDPVAHVNIGLIYARQGETARARQAFEEALRLDPTLAPARDALAELGGR
jgi:tetratricopeptide (TPR) repeat protein